MPLRLARLAVRFHGMHTLRRRFERAWRLDMAGIEGFEPSATRSQSERSTKLS